MATYARALLTGSTDGKPIIVAATSIGSGTTIHTAVSGSVSWDEIYIWASNVTASDATLTLSWGSVTDPDGLICKSVTIPANSPPIPIVTGQVLNNSEVVKAASGTGSAINLTGYVNRIS